MAKNSYAEYFFFEIIFEILTWSDPKLKFKFWSTRSNFEITE